MVLPLGGHCSPHAALWDTPAHAAHSKHSMTQRHLPAQTPFWQHLCIPGCAHECLHMYLFIHTHMRAKTSVHAHVYICAFTCAHVPTSLHTHTHIQACSHPRHAGTHTCACTCSQKCLCTGVHTQGTVVCAYMSVHTHTHVSARTQMDTCGCVNVCVCSVYTSVCTRASTTLRPAPAGGGRDYLKGPRQWAHAVASARLAHDPTATALPQLSQFRMMGCGRDTFTHLGEWVEDDSMLRGKLRQGWVPSSPCHLVRTDKAPCAPSPRTWRLPQHTASR